MTPDWPFADPPTTAVFTSKRILAGLDWIHYVTHDAEDGAWQFHPYAAPTPDEEAAVVSLRSIMDMDPAVKDLSDLPLGWCAWRADRDAPWQRSAKG